MEQAVEKMKEMQFSPRFIRGCERSLCESLIHLHSPVNALIVFDRKRCIVEKTKSRFYVCSRALSTFRNVGKTDIIYANAFFSIYRQSRGNKTDFVIVIDKKTFARFNYDYESSPLIVEGKIPGYGADIVFLSFLDKQETIAIIRISGNKFTFFTGLPFAVTSANESAEVVLQCGLKATVSIEQLEEISGSLAFSF